ncbi:hypothetical protein FO519_008997 [Halicephalobus sp. NKZ332]|nr:hypothetical protein FO519_008997 [Halicephalobus sp. NKZ332]
MTIHLFSMSFDSSRIPSAVVDRFISIVPDILLDSFSKTSKSNYRHCMILRGIPVNWAIKDGRHLVYVWLPFFNCNSTFYLNGFVEDDNDIRDYPMTKNFRYVDARGYGPTFDFILKKCLSPKVRQLYLDFWMIPIPEEINKLFSQLLEIEVFSLTLTVHEENTQEYLKMVEIAEHWSVKYPNLRYFYFSISYGERIFMSIKKTKITKIERLEITSSVEAVSFVFDNYRNQKDRMMVMIIEDIVSKNWISEMVTKLKAIKLLKIVSRQVQNEEDGTSKEVVLRVREGRQCEERLSA